MKKSLDFGIIVTKAISVGYIKYQMFWASFNLVSGIPSSSPFLSLSLACERRCSRLHSLQMFLAWDLLVMNASGLSCHYFLLLKN